MADLLQALGIFVWGYSMFMCVNTNISDLRTEMKQLQKPEIETVAYKMTLYCDVCGQETKDLDFTVHNGDFYALGQEKRPFFQLCPDCKNRVMDLIENIKEKNE